MLGSKLRLPTIVYRGFSVSRVNKAIPGTNGRYRLEDKGIFDNFKCEFVHPDSNGVYNLKDTILEGLDKVTIEWIFAVTAYYCNVPIDKLKEVDYTRRSGNDDILSVKSIRPIFKIDCKEYPGHRYIPGYSNYVINEDGTSLIRVGVKFARLEPSLNISSNRFEYNLTEDTFNRSATIMRYRLVALAWLDYTYDDLDTTIDHLDGDCRNDHYSNLEFVSRSVNTRRYQVLRKDNISKSLIHCIDLDDPKYTVKDYNTIKALAEELGKGSPSILEYLKRNTDGRCYGARYVIWRSDQPKPDLTLCIDKRYNTSAKHIIVATNILTGEVRKDTGSIRKTSDNPEYHVSKKLLEKTLKAKDKRVFPGGWKFEYIQDMENPPK